MNGMWHPEVMILEGRFHPYTVIAIDEYERVNLLWYLSLVGYPVNVDIKDCTSGLEPFNYCNNGDWVGQIIQKLEAAGPISELVHPNGSYIDLKGRIDQMLEKKLLEMSAHDFAYIMEKRNVEKGR